VHAGNVQLIRPRSRWESAPVHLQAASATCALLLLPRSATRRRGFCRSETSKSLSDNHAFRGFTARQEPRRLALPPWSGSQL